MELIDFLNLAVFFMFQTTLLRLFTCIFNLSFSLLDLLLLFDADFFRSVAFCSLEHSDYVIILLYIGFNFSLKGAYSFTSLLIIIVLKEILFGFNLESINIYSHWSNILSSQASSFWKSLFLFVRTELFYTIEGHKSLLLFLSKIL